MMDRILRRHLEPIARQDRRGRWLRALTLGWLGLSGLGLAVLGVHAATGWGSAWWLPLVAVLALLWLGGTWRWHRRQADDVSVVARRIEQEHPDLHALLLTAVEQQPDPESHELNFLQKRVIREALEQDWDQEWRLAAQRRLRHARLAHYASAAVLAGVLAGLWHIAPPRAAGLSLVHRGITVTPGDTNLEKGASLVVLARFDGSVPAEATLVLRPAHDAERRIPLTKNLNDPVFGASVPEIQNALTYHIEYGQNATRAYRVEVFEFPRLEKADARITYPTYTGQPEKVIPDTRRISAVEGSTLDYTFHLNKPVRTATLVPKEGAPRELQVDPAQPRRYTSRFQLDQSARYELILVDEAGRTNRLPPSFVLEALTNRVPDLKFAFPKGDQRVSPLEEISFQGEASDDFGLQAYGLCYNLAGEDVVSVELGREAGPHEKRSLAHLLPLEKLDAQPDQLLSYHLWADDIGPDGEVRRTVSEMFFAEIRPFDEIFREGQPQDPNQARQQQENQQGQPGGNQAERLADIQKQIITATWNLQRRERTRTPSAAFQADATTIQESQDAALDQLRGQQEEEQDPRQAALLENVAEAMKKASGHLATAAQDNVLPPLSPALAAEQSAYQALLQLAAREHQVAQGQRGQRSASSRSSRAQRQLNQLNLRQSENRYETERQAAPPQDPQQREQLQAFNRLKELAQRQQDVNERLRELQAALQEARTDAEREALRARLQRLQEEQQQMLADVDELRQRMDRPENQSSMAESREQLDQTRRDVQDAAEAMNRGNPSQALASGARAQQDLQELRDEFRRRTSSQFADDMRSLRNQARDLAQRQEDLGQQLDQLENNASRKTLTDSEQRQSLARQLDEQKDRLNQIVQQATEVTQKAEPVEPLLARQLYDTLRQTAQDDPRNLQETTDELLGQGRLLRGAYDRLRTGKERSQRAVEVAANLLRDGFPAEANNLEERARQSINQLRTGVEQAAESVLGDDTEALRRAREEVDALARELGDEIARGQARASTNAQASATRPRPGNRANPEDPSAAADNPEGQPGDDPETRTAARRPSDNPRGEAPPDDSAPRVARTRESGQDPQTGQGRPDQPSAPGQEVRGQGGAGRELAANNTEPGPGERAQEAREGQPGAGRRPPGGSNREASRSAAQAGRGEPREGERPTREGEGQAQPANPTFLDQLGGTQDGGAWGGPLTGPGYREWSDRLRDVEEMLDLPELRAEAARIRDRARDIRLDLRRHARAPQWDLVNLELAAPLTDLRTRIGEELARRESRDAIVPLDRDPVPQRFAERVRRYYEELGKGPTPTGTAPRP